MQVGRLRRQSAQHVHAGLPMAPATENETPMHNLSMRLVRGIGLAALIAAAPLTAAFAQEATATTPASTSVVATVGGEAITEADMSFAAEDMAQDLSQMPPEERRAFLLRVLIDMKVMSQAARAAGMDQTELFAQRRQYLEERALRRAYFTDAIAAQVTEEAARAEYDKFVAEFQPAEEVRASHILVETEETANALKAELDGGADFATLARENSIDPGAANGGDLGFFGRGMMVAPFEEAAFALANPGDVSAPVQSQFGWHIIKLTEKRQSTPPAFDQVASQIQQKLLMEAFTAKVEELMGATEVDVPDPELSAKLAAQQEAEAATQ